MNAAVLLFLGLMGIFIFSIVLFVKKNQKLHQSQIAREQAFLSTIMHNMKDKSPL